MNKKNTRPSPGQDQQQKPGENVDVSAEPDKMQQESPRKCKICGGPNHYGCGCEARQRRTVGMTEPTGPQPAEPTGPQPAEPQPAETPDDQRPTDAEIDDTIVRGEKMFGHIEGMSDNLSDLYGGVVTLISYLSNIDQHLKEIHAMVKARIRKDGDQS